MGTRLQDLKSRLQIGSGGVRMVGIWGIRGGGKTTLASSIYPKISGKFDSCCFVGNIKEETSMKTLQEKILSTVLKIEVKVGSVDEGKHKIKTRLGHKNVLLVLDDIDNRKQLEALAGSHDWFGDGSRLIITTRDEHLLRAHKVDEVSHVSLLSHDEAIRLFNKYAYNDNNLVEDYKMLSKRVISYASGLPLALKVLASFLCDKDKDEWISTLSRLRDIQEMEIVKILKISYDGLTPLEKELFLDIACFWRGRNKDVAMEVFVACGFHPVIGVKVLIQKSLITISSKDRNFDKHDVFEMHDLIQEMGHYIVRGEHPNNPEKHTRLWRPEEIEDVCSRNETMKNNITEAIVCYDCPSGLVKFLSKMKKLRLLCVYNRLKKGDISEVPEYLSNELRYMYLSGYPASWFPESFQPRKLVVMKLYSTLQEELWKGKKDLPSLKELEISDAVNLVRTPDFGGLPCLQKLSLKKCPNLKRIEGNFHASKHMKKCEIIGEYEKLIKLPKDLFHECIQLEELKLEYTRLACNFYLPRSIRRLTLNRLGMKYGEIPFGIGELSNLQELDLGWNDFSVINISLLRLTRLKLLNLSFCFNLVELPQLPTSIAILNADFCDSLEVVGDIINKNCKWLCQVSICNFDPNEEWLSVTGGERLLETMLQGNAIENGCTTLNLKGVEIPKWFRPRLLRGQSYRLNLPENWFNNFSGFLFCTALRFNAVSASEYYSIIMEHEKAYMDFEKKVYWDEGADEEAVDTWVGYVSFGLLKHTTWWDPTSTHIYFSCYEDWLCTGIGVGLVSKTRQLQTTTNSSSDDDYKCDFHIHHDSMSRLEGGIHWSNKKTKGRILNVGVSKL